jgi:hypothetical protein
MQVRGQERNINKSQGAAFGSPRSVCKVIQLGFENNGTRRVRFATKNRQLDIVIIPAELELAEEEMTSLWYTDDEYRLFKRSQQFIVKMMGKNMNSLEDDDELCPRGLEAKTKMGYKQRKEAIEKGWDAVLIEQDKKCPDPLRIAILYGTATAPCSVEALLRGKRDEKDVSKLNADSR